MKEAIERLNTAIDVLSDPTATALVRREDLVLLVSAVQPRTVATIGDIVTYEDDRFIVVSIEDSYIGIFNLDGYEEVYKDIVLPIVKYATDESVTWVREEAHFDEQTNTSVLEGLLL